MKEQKCLFPLAVQTVLPSDYRKNTDFQTELRTLQELGFAGVELNIAEPEKEDAYAIQRFLDEFNLRLTMFASGLTAKSKKLSLSSANAEVREKSIRTCKEMIAFAARVRAGVIIGFLKGAPTRNAKRARSRFADSLKDLIPYAEHKRVTLVIEATNRYESSVANSLADTVDLVESLASPYVRILPDTFHMNIEEAKGPAAALKACTGYYESVHISDNNRYFPGYGAIDFAEIFATLKMLEYRGQIAIEGNIRRSFIEDIRASMGYLTPLLLQ